VGAGVGSSVETCDTAWEFASADPERLAIRLLGPIGVRRGGETPALPRSRQCRALLAYLAMAPRPQRREHLCDLLYELPDDPRGALRWSLSKLRPLLGDALQADRDMVGIDPAAVAVDARALTAPQAIKLPTPQLEALAHGGAFADGLDLPRCPDFQSWLYAVREDVRRARLAVLSELVGRLRGEPEQALVHARARAALDPLDEAARADLVALLAASGRGEEAELQRKLAAAALDEAGIPVPDALLRPRAPAAPPAAASGVQRIGFRTAPDGTRIAWSAAGAGPPLVKTANWMGHLEFEWESPLLSHWLHELSHANTLIRYDARGNGLSDRHPADLSLAAFIADLEAVTAPLSEPFDLVGISQGAPVAIAFAARHPGRVRRLVLFGGFASGWRHSRTPEIPAQWEAMIALAGLGWGRNNPAFRQMFTSLFAPRAGPEQADWFNELQRVSAAPQEAQRLLAAIGAFDVSDLLGAVRAPTIVFHCRADALVPFGAGRHLAANIAGAEFVALESDNHLPLADEPAWAVLVERLRHFLARPD
jgi:pimeloyl-ACP methyl ester carboxylesterase/DNA-binding SARP family transcriptional activator